MDGWVDGWVGGGVGGWMDAWVGGWVDGWIYEWMGGWMDGCVGGWMNGWRDGCIGRLNRCGTAPSLSVCEPTDLILLFVHLLDFAGMLGVLSLTWPLQLAQSALQLLLSQTPATCMSRDVQPRSQGFPWGAGNEVAWCASLLWRALSVFLVYTILHRESCMFLWQCMYTYYTTPSVTYEYNIAMYK